jgi:hypothetical protein
MGFGLVRVLECKRTLAREQMLFGQGRSEIECRDAGVPEEYSDIDQHRVVWCRPEDSSHVAGRALDVDVSHYIRDQVDVWGDLAKSLNIEWGGNWTVQDWGHFEVHA